MPKAKLVLLVLIVSISSFNCTKQIEQTDILIEYELLDDVSPVTAIFSVENELGWHQWTVDSINVTSNKKNCLEHTFSQVGMSNIEFNANGINGEKYYGNLNIEIPEIANKLIFTGYTFKEDYTFEILDDSLNLIFDYYDGTNYTRFNSRISKYSFENIDSVSLENPIIIGMPDLNFIEPDNVFIFFKIEGHTSNYQYFKDNFFIQARYFHDRLYSPNYIYLDNKSGENKERIFLICDWAN